MANQICYVTLPPELQPAGKALKDAAGMLESIGGKDKTIELIKKAVESLDPTPEKAPVKKPVKEKDK